MDLLTFDIFKFFSETVDTDDQRYHNREISWLAFNHRVLQESKDPRNPLYERLKFLAIYSSNSDEFFRVRVASIRSLAGIHKTKRKKYDIEPDLLLEQIHKTVKKQQEEYGGIFRHHLLKEMKEHGVYLIADKDSPPEYDEFVHQYFKDIVLPHVKIYSMGRSGGEIFLQNKQLYLAVQIRQQGVHSTKPEYAIAEIPAPALPRFVELPPAEKRRYIMFLDDIVRKNLPFLFPGFDVLSSYAIKLTRDAELYFEDELNGDFVEVLKKAVKTRKTGKPSRFLYDAAMPPEFHAPLKQALHLSEKEMIPGGRYHNFSDFFSFPNPDGVLPTYEPMPPLRVPRLDAYQSMFDAMTDRDWMLHFPYHSYDPVIRFIQESAVDPSVEQIRITLYRVASHSSIVNALILAAKNGKKVTVFVELTARFDEEMNMYWAEELRAAKAKVLYTIPKLKVHSKILLVTRTEGSVKRRYGYLSTGNFNEKTATLYTDHGLFTSDIRLTNEIMEVFKFLNKKSHAVKTRHLLTAPFTMRSRLLELIDQEIDHARRKLPASIFIKVNSLEDREMIDKLYEASAAGVTVSVIARGICCLIPGERPFSRNITAMSIVGRFLEHGRIFRFHNDGNEIIYVSSADWMMRNLSRRVEVAFPVYDPHLKRELSEMIDLQLADTVKARVIDKHLKNVYRKPGPHKPVDSQREIYRYLQRKTSA